jgi:hypothetical protein
MRGGDIEASASICQRRRAPQMHQRKWPSRAIEGRTAENAEAQALVECAGRLVLLVHIDGEAPPRNA